MVVADDEMMGASIWRMTIAYTIDQDLYKQWSVGGAVWIDDDPDPDAGNTSILPQHFCNTSAIKEVFKNAVANLDCKIMSIHTYLDLNIILYFHKSNLTREAITALVSTPVCVSVPGIAEVQFAKTEPQPQIAKLQPQQAGNTLLSTLVCAEGQKTKIVQMPQNSKPASQTPETTFPQNKGVVEEHHS